MTEKPKTGRRILAGTRKAARVVLPSPSAALGVGQIRDGYGLIKTYWTRLRDVRAAQEALDGIARASGGGDIMAEGQRLGLSPGETVRRMERQRSSTRLRALFGVTLSVLAFLVWAWNMVSGHIGPNPWLTTIYFLGFSVAAGLSAFRNGWLNWQLRRGRRGTATEYLTTSEGFWPN